MTQVLGMGWEIFREARKWKEKSFNTEDTEIGRRDRREKKEEKPRAQAGVPVPQG
jgi:hypothetical protein